MWDSYAICEQEGNFERKIPSTTECGFCLETDPGGATKRLESKNE
jgi:hypothetical protein